MPPHKKPKSLEKICMNAVASLVLNACHNIEKKCGSIDEEISRCKLKILQGYLVSKIRPLFDELCQVVLEVYCFRDKRDAISLAQKRDVRSLLYVISCQQTKTLNLRGISQITDLKFINSESFFKNQISKLRNIVKLDISQVILTDEMFEEISRVCKNLREISLKSNLEFSSKDSVYKLLECRRLQIVKIEFVQWNDKREIIACIRRLVRILRQLRHIHFDEMGTVLLGEGQTTALRTLTEKCVNLNSLRNIVELCPSLLELNIDAHYSSQQEKDKMLNILAESSLSLRALQLHRFSFTQEMSRLLKLKGNNLLKLTLGLNAGTITYSDICTIGANCPNLEQLEIVEMFDIISRNFFGASKFQIQTPKIPSRLFVNLKCLVLRCDSEWDQRILSLVLSHAKSLEKISLTNVFPKNVDAIAETMNANPLTDLKSFKLVVERYGSEMAVSSFEQRSIRRLIESCSELTSLELDCVFDVSAIRYLEDLERRIRGDNLDLQLSYTHVKYGLNICDGGAPGDYILYEEY